MNWRRRTGMALVAAGALLLGVYAGPTVYGRTMAHLAVAEFRAESRSQSLWDSARIRAYRRTLGVALPQPEAVLRVARLGIEAPVFEGAGELQMNRGLGHIAGTALPGSASAGSAGNIGIAGHRDGFFRPLKDVRVGDVIELQQPTGSRERYVVRATEVIAPSDNAVLRSDGRRRLTLVTCYPFYYIGPAPQRFIVQAEAVDVDVPATPVANSQLRPASIATFRLAAADRGAPSIFNRQPFNYPSTGDQ